MSSKKGILGRRAWGGAAILLSLWAAKAPAHDSAHNYTYLDNGTIKVGREQECGGMCSWVSEVGGQNIVNNMNSVGGSFQAAVFDTGGWNPTQAGDGPNFAQCDQWYADSSYIYSRCIPLLFYNDPPYGGPPRPVNEARFLMWNEFLPNSNNRAYIFRTVWDYTGPVIGQSSPQFLPCHISQFQYNNWTTVKHYNGTAPWTGGGLTSTTDPLNGLVATDYRMTENWSALVNASDWGLGVMSKVAYGSTMFFNSAPPEPPGVEEQNVKEMDHPPRFQIGLQPGLTEQLRENISIEYLGDVTAARNFFATYKPVKNNSFSDDFDDGNHWGWDANSNPIQMVNYGAPHNNVVKVGPYANWSSDLSLNGKTWGDATYSVDVKHESGPANDWYGMAIRKNGEGHAWNSQSGYYLAFLTPAGNVTLYSPDNGTLGSATVPGFVGSNWNNLSVIATGFNLVVKVNGTTYIDVTDAAQKFAAGYVSFLTLAGVGASYDNFTVTASGGDSTAPAQVTGLSATGQSNRVALAWTNPADSDWRWTRLVRKTGSAPTHWQDGFPVYEGKLGAYNDVDVVNGTTYHYAVYTLDHAHNYSAAVTASATPNGAVPVANFTASTVLGPAPLTVNFTDTSSGSPTSWAWDFQNNGSTDSTAQNPSFVYTSPGTYTVKLTATNASGSDQEIKTNYIVAADKFTFYSLAADDGWVLESTETSGVGGSNNSGDTGTSALRIGDDGGDKQYKVVLSVFTALIPDNATIDSAVLKIKRGSLTGSNPFGTHGQCRVDIVTGTFGAQALANGDFQAAATATNVVTGGMSNPTSNGAVSTGNLNATGLSAINKTGYTQLKLYFSTDDNDDLGADYTGFYSGNNGTQANWPYLEVVWH